MPSSNNKMCVTRNEEFTVKPFLRWAGGKSHFVDEILKFFPPLERTSVYYEPFLGAGSVFLSFRPNKAVLSDLNGQLIHVFKAVRDNPSIVYRYLRELAAKDNEAFYYKVRVKYNSAGFSYQQAARFIYLNKACFNGIFRVNTEGKFNVPYGYKKSLAVPSLEGLSAVSEVLKRANIVAKDYRDAVRCAKKGDLVYLDPPYPPINGSSYFTHYTKERFSNSDQVSVAKLARELSERGCFVAVTNADMKLVRNLYQGWHIQKAQRTRWITCAKHKHKVSELIITNYRLGART